MSFSFESMNHNKKTMKDGLNLDQMGDFVSWKNYIGQDICVDGFFFTKTKYGDQVVIVGHSAQIPDIKKINIPKRFVEPFKQIRDNDEALEQVIAGKLVLANVRELDSENGHTGTFDYKTV